MLLRPSKTVVIDAQAHQPLSTLFLERYRRHLLDTIQTVDLGAVQRAVQWLQDARDADQQVFVCGNGGSAATASHFVCDMVKGASCGQPVRFRIMALTDSMATITAYANDVGYERAFVEHLRNFARDGDVLMAISGSGRSANVLHAIEYANSIGCRTIGLTGRDGGELAKLGQLHIHVPEQHMGRIEDAHMMACHMIAYSFIDSIPSAA